MGLSSAQVKDLYQQGKGNVQIENIGKTNAEIVKENIFTYFNLIFLIMAIPMHTRYLMVFICISLMISDVEHFVMYLLAI